MSRSAPAHVALGDPTPVNLLQPKRLATALANRCTESAPFAPSLTSWHNTEVDHTRGGFRTCVNGLAGAEVTDQSLRWEAVYVIRGSACAP
jgi:hypothetical protein